MWQSPDFIFHALATGPVDAQVAGVAHVTGTMTRLPNARDGTTKQKKRLSNIRTTDTTFLAPLLPVRLAFSSYHPIYMLTQLFVARFESFVKLALHFWP